MKIIIAKSLQKTAYSYGPVSYQDKTFQKPQSESETKVIKIDLDSKLNKIPSLFSDDGFKANIKIVLSNYFPEANLDKIYDNDLTGQITVKKDVYSGTIEQVLDIELGIFDDKMIPHMLKMKDAQKNYLIKQLNWMI